ncbi:unnamed protein product [Psylliodes chrysocephalus]|uniref:Cadherin domain-containing protein n=1 Tax=Psylliodes chrysocephalus TaxID=3402493 RepID=A0A9P0CLN3_9CUCU|nr:unnamed protein product [Psylliodes chrysocephala]
MDFGKSLLVLTICLAMILEIASAIYLMDMKSKNQLHFSRRRRSYRIQLIENNNFYVTPIPLFKIIGATNCSDLCIVFKNNKNFKYEIKNCIFYASQSFDYEKPNDRKYVFKIITLSLEEMPTVVHLSIKNIDDEGPVIDYPHCYFKENTMYTRINSTCHFKVSDPDGFIKFMDLRIHGTANEENLFDLNMLSPNIRESDTEANVTLSTTRPLDYEKNNTYVFFVSATDSAGNTASRIANIVVTNGLDHT